MALNQAERQLIASWAEQCRNASTWLSGNGAKVMKNLAKQMDEVAEGEVTAKEAAAESE